MNRRLMLGAGGPAVKAPTPGEPDPGDGPPPDGTVPLPVVPYSFPLIPSFNVTMPAITPTDDETGQVIHPDVVDFGGTPWNGHRFWMAVTAFAGAEPPRENPHILCSNDGYEWEWPAGLTNPIDPWPGAVDGSYNSDTDLHYDPDTDELVVTWREVNGTHQIIWLSTSTTGSVWSEPAMIADIVEPGGSLETTSQSLIKVSPTEWRMYFAGGSGTGPKARYFTASNRLGPYTSTAYLTYTGPGSMGPYHGDVILHGGRYYGLFSTGGNEYPCVSDDGVTFTTAAPILSNSGAVGDYKQNLYRASMQIDPGGEIVHVWYSGANPDLYDDGTMIWQGYVFYTRVPFSKWPA